ncbi:MULTISPECIES: hypothetical protein [unclassified Ruegeria]|uniref:hypothetical protein n=1 Tax=unclassified Ruegeria TaxID=2625375 RepID=UPI00148830C5|nr:MULTISPECIES: hypothetical protein [unclassified Ruegeria]
MSPEKATNRALAFGAIVVALFIALVWVPMDTDTGLIEKVRRQVSIGDAFAPTLAAVFIGVGGMLLAIQRLSEMDGRLRIANLRFLATLLVLLLVCFAIMRWTGPAAVALTGAGENYASLRTTAPWNIVGYFFGGTVMIAALIAMIEGHSSFRAFLIGVVSTTLLILLYDVPFDDLLLPPNGDV